jgi:chromosome segregation ATPase
MDKNSECERLRDQLANADSGMYKNMEAYESLFVELSNNKAECEKLKKHLQNIEAMLSYLTMQPNLHKFEVAGFGWAHARIRSAMREIEAANKGDV